MWWEVDMLLFHHLPPPYIFTSYKDSSSLQGFTVAACHPGYVLEGEYCVCNHSHTDIFRCDESNRYIYIRVCQQQQPLYIRMYIYVYIYVFMHTSNVIVEIYINCTQTKIGATTILLALSSFLHTFLSAE